MKILIKQYEPDESKVRLPHSMEKVVQYGTEILQKKVAHTMLRSRFHKYLHGIKISKQQIWMSTQLKYKMTWLIS